MKHVIDTTALEWRAFEAAGVEGYESRPAVIGSEYTDAYSMDVVRVAPGGHSPAHTDEGRHAFYILEGQGRLVADGQEFAFSKGDIVKVPPGSVHAVSNDGAVPLVFLTIYDPPRVRK